MYSVKNIELIKEIKQLVRVQGYTLAGAETFLKNKQTVGSKEEAIKKLNKIKAFLIEIKEELTSEDDSPPSSKNTATGPNAANQPADALNEPHSNNHTAG